MTEYTPRRTKIKNSILETWKEIHFEKHGEAIEKPEPWIDSLIEAIADEIDHRTDEALK